MVLVALTALLSLIAVSGVNAYNWQKRYPVDCAYSAWSAWSVHGGGMYEKRTRHIRRHARNGGKGCHGNKVEFRVITTEAPTGSADEFLKRLVVGRTPSYSLGQGQRYSLARDIVIALDRTVSLDVFPYYKSLLSYIVGKICSDIGNRRQESRISIVPFGTGASIVHSFGHKQSRALLQDAILKTPRSNSTLHSDLKAAINKAQHSFSFQGKYTRRYNEATKEVLLVTTYKDYCAESLLRVAERLKKTAEVYVVVIGGEESRRLPNNWCLQYISSAPLQSHFIHLQSIRDISEESSKLLVQYPSENVCSKGRTTQNGGSQFTYNRNN